MPFLSRHGIASHPPTAQRTFTPVGRQGGRNRPREIGTQLAQPIRQLFAQTIGKMDSFLLQPPTASAKNEHGRNSTLLMLLEEKRHQSQWQLVFSGGAPALTCQHRLVSKVTPAALAFNAPEQRWMRLQRFA